MSSHTKPYGKQILLVLNPLELDTPDPWRSFDAVLAVIDGKTFDMSIRKRSAEQIGDILTAAHLEAIHGTSIEMPRFDSTMVDGMTYRIVRGVRTTVLVLACLWHETEDFNSVDVTVLTPENHEYAARVRHHVTIDYAIRHALSQPAVAQQATVPPMEVPPPAGTKMMPSESQDTTMPITA